MSTLSTHLVFFFTFFYTSMCSSRSRAATIARTSLTVRSNRATRVSIVRSAMSCTVWERTSSARSSSSSEGSVMQVGLIFPPNLFSSFETPSLSHDSLKKKIRGREKRFRERHTRAWSVFFFSFAKRHVQHAADHSNCTDCIWNRVDAHHVPELSKLHA